MSIKNRILNSRAFAIWQLLTTRDHNLDCPYCGSDADSVTVVGSVGMCECEMDVCLTAGREV